MYRKILVPLDGSQLAECVFPHVEAVAEGCGTPEVIFLRVVEPMLFTPSYVGGEPTFDWKYLDIINEQNALDAEKYLEHLPERIKFTKANMKTVQLTGKAGESIADYAEKNSVDLIILATHGRSGVSRWIWGSVADKVLRSACTPVLMVRAPGCFPGITKSH